MLVPAGNNMIATMNRRAARGKGRAKGGREREREREREEMDNCCYEHIIINYYNIIFNILRVVFQLGNC